MKPALKREAYSATTATVFIVNDDEDVRWTRFFLARSIGPPKRLDLAAQDFFDRFNATTANCPALGVSVRGDLKQTVCAP